MGEEGERPLLLAEKTEERAGLAGVHDQMIERDRALPASMLKLLVRTWLGSRVSLKGRTG